MLICNLKIVSINFYTLQHFLYQDFAFLVIGKSPSFLRFHSQTISEVGEEEEEKKKKTLTGSHMQERDSDSVWKESHFYFLHLFHYSKGVNFNWHFPTKKIILQGKKNGGNHIPEACGRLQHWGKRSAWFQIFSGKTELLCSPWKEGGRKHLTLGRCGQARAPASSQSH